MANSYPCKKNTIMNDKVYFIKESEYPQYLYWISKLNFMAKEYNNSPNFWNAIDDDNFMKFMNQQYGIKLVLDTSNLTIGVQITNQQKKLLLDIKCP